jgi:hypothetical protein
MMDQRSSIKSQAGVRARLFEGELVGDEDYQAGRDAHQKDGNDNEEKEGEDLTGNDHEMSETPATTRADRFGEWWRARLVSEFEKDLGGLAAVSTACLRGDISYTRRALFLLTFSVLLTCLPITGTGVDCTTTRTAVDIPHYTLITAYIVVCPAQVNLAP